MSSSSGLSISGLSASVAGKKILSDFSLDIKAGEVHAVMGPNGSGKSTLSHVLMGKPGYEVESGEFLLDGQNMFELDTWQRARAGLFLAMQYPTEVPGVSTEKLLAAAAPELTGVSQTLKAEASSIGLDKKLLDRSLNVDLSGGEQKRNETVQLSVLKPKFAILDELDSGLDVDALAAVANKVESLTEELNLGVLVITHYNRMLSYLQPDKVHILSNGSIAESGGPELAEKLEESGYAQYS